MVQIKRIYEDPSPEDGVRVLVDRLWPRGVSKEEAALDRWMKEVAPSDELRRWFDHDPEKWEAFRERYVAELDEKDEPLRFLRNEAKEGTLTLLYAARDTEYNHAVVLRDVLRGEIGESEQRP